MKPINQNAPARCTKKILIEATPEKVWAVLTDINQWTAWQTDIVKAKLNGPLTAGATFVWKTGGANIHSTLHTVAPFEQFGWTGKTFGLYAIHNWTLREKQKQTEVSVAESMEGLLAGVFKKAFNKSLEKGMQRWLDLLKNACENQTALKRSGLKISSTGTDW